MKRTKKSDKKGKEVAIRKKPGPKPEWDETTLFQIELLGLLGATNAQIALFFGKVESTIDNWIKKYPELREARMRGGLGADMKAVHSLFQRATGYNFQEEELKYVAGRWQKIKVKKHEPPNVTALIFWLKNRQRGQWTDAHKVDHTGKINHVHNRLEDIPIEQLSKKAQSMMFEISKLQLTEGKRDN